MVVLAVAMYGDQPVTAYEIRGQLEVFGFEVTTQHVSPLLQRIVRKDLPPVVRTDHNGYCWSYRLTQWGWTELWNRGFKALGMPVTFPHKGDRHAA
jgi:hypothetical protein